MTRNLPKYLKRSHDVLVRGKNGRYYNLFTYKSYTWEKALKAGFKTFRPITKPSRNLKIIREALEDPDDDYSGIMSRHFRDKDY